MSVHEVSGGWVVRWRQGTKQHSRKFSRELGFTRESAEAFDHTVKRRKRTGGVDPLASEQDFAGFVEEWWRGHHPQVSERTRDNQRSYLENRILPRFAGYRLCDVTSPEIERFRIELVQDGAGEATVRKLLYLLSAIFAQAQLLGLITSNPAQPVKKPAAYRQRIIQPFPPERVEAVRAWFLRKGDLEGATMVSALAYSGPRPEEAYGRLTWADVGDQTIYYRGAKTKHNRVTRLLGSLSEDLALWRRESGVMVGQVFGWSGSRFNNWRRRRFHRATEAAGIELTRPYDLRHAFVTLLLGEGRSLSYVAKQLGHSWATCDRWYSHLEHLEEAEIGAESRIVAARQVPAEFLGQREADSL